MISIAPIATQSPWILALAAADPPPVSERLVRALEAQQAAEEADIASCRQLEADVALRDGSLVHVRPIRAEDEPGLLGFLGALSEEDRRMRFCSLTNDLSRTAHDEVAVDHVHSLGLLATVGSPERIVGHALFGPARDGRAEVAFAIAAEYQHRGLATLLLLRLAEVAAAKGVATFGAIMLAENRHMLHMLRGSGFPITTHYDSNKVEATFPTSLDGHLHPRPARRGSA